MVTSNRMVTFDRVSLGLPENYSQPRTLAYTAIPRPENREHYLRGPIPLKWLQQAARLRGSALQVAVTIWYRAGLEKNGTIRLGNGALATFGVSSDSKRRALITLEEAGLIGVVREANKNPVVTILAAKA